MRRAGIPSRPTQGQARRAGCARFTPGTASGRPYPGLSRRPLTTRCQRCLGDGRFSSSAAMSGAGRRFRRPIEEYKALQSQIAGEKQRADNWRATAEGAQASASSAASSASAAASSAAQRQAELDRREAAVVAREQAVTAIEQQVAANSIEEGTWTVGRD